MSTLQCTYRDHHIAADVLQYADNPTPWAAGCRITDPQGNTTRRMPLPLEYAFLADLEKAQHASIAHGKWLVDQHLDHGRELFAKAA